MINASPTAPLVWRTVLSTAAATPPRSPPTSLVADTVSGVNAAAVPNPNTTPGSATDHR